MSEDKNLNIVNRYGICRFIVYLFLSLTLLSGCTSTRDEKLEKKLISELIKHKTDKVSSIDLRETIGNSWRKICIQGPYQLQEDFEKLSG